MQRKLLHTASPKMECIFSQWKIFDVWEKNITRGCSGKWMFLANCYPTPLYRKVWDLNFLHAILQWLRKYYESLLESLITFMMHFKRDWKQSWTEISLQLNRLMRVERRFGISLDNFWKVPVLETYFLKLYDQILTNQRSLWWLTWYRGQSCSQYYFRIFEMTYLWW